MLRIGYRPSQALFIYWLGDDKIFHVRQLLRLVLVLLDLFAWTCHFGRVPNREIVKISNAALGKDFNFVLLECLKTLSLLGGLLSFCQKLLDSNIFHGFSPTNDRSIY